MQNETTTCATCKATIYKGEGKKCKTDKCPIKIEDKKEVIFNPYKKPNLHAGFPILILFLFLPLFSSAQDTICLPKDRLARIADTLARATQFEGAYLQCDKLLEEQYKLTIAKHEQMILYKQNLSLEEVKTAQLTKESEAWKEVAENANKELIATNKRLNKARKARKVWMGGAIGTFGVLGAGITTAIILLKN